MRISDWSSDVCSSDLHRTQPVIHPAGRGQGRRPRQGRHPPARAGAAREGRRLPAAAAGQARAARTAPADPAGGSQARSEEHTTELQSLMRISYAVICLKKKKESYAKLHIET